MPVTTGQILSAKTLALLTLPTFILAFSPPHRYPRPRTKQDWDAWRLSKKAKREALRSEGKTANDARVEEEIEAKKPRKRVDKRNTLKRGTVRAFEDRVEQGFPKAVEQDVMEKDDEGIREEGAEVQGLWRWLRGILRRWWRWR